MSIKLQKEIRKNVQYKTSGELDNFLAYWNSLIERKCQTIDNFSMTQNWKSRIEIENENENTDEVTSIIAKDAEESQN